MEARRVSDCRSPHAACAPPRLATAASRPGAPRHPSLTTDHAGPPHPPHPVTHPSARTAPPAPESRWAWTTRARRPRRRAGGRRPGRRRRPRRGTGRVPALGVGPRRVLCLTSLLVRKCRSGRAGRGARGGRQLAFGGPEKKQCASARSPLAGLLHSSVADGLPFLPVHDPGTRVTPAQHTPQPARPHLDLAPTLSGTAWTRKRTQPVAHSFPRPPARAFRVPDEFSLACLAGLALSLFSSNVRGHPHPGPAPRGAASARGRPHAWLGQRGQGRRERGQGKRDGGKHNGAARIGERAGVTGCCCSSPHFDAPARNLPGAPRPPPGRLVRGTRIMAGG